VPGLRHGDRRGEALIGACRQLLHQAVHALRVADALQLAAAPTWEPQPARTAELGCLDGRLRDAAAREGFALAPAELEA
jgi:hypothetical protein